MNEERKCVTCSFYDGDFCTKEWNNADPEWRVLERDIKEPDDSCDEWEGE